MHVIETTYMTTWRLLTPKTHNVEMLQRVCRGCILHTIYVLMNENIKLGIKYLGFSTNNLKTITNILTESSSSIVVHTANTSFKLFSKMQTNYIFQTNAHFFVTRQLHVQSRRNDRKL